MNKRVWKQRKTIRTRDWPIFSTAGLHHLIVLALHHIQLLAQDIPDRAFILMYGSESRVGLYWLQGQFGTFSSTKWHHMGFLQGTGPS
jgi:hypothetical protein